MLLAWFHSGYISRYVDNAGVVGESETVVQQQRDVERCETIISYILPASFSDGRQRFVVRLKDTVTQ